MYRQEQNYHLFHRAPMYNESGLKTNEQCSAAKHNKKLGSSIPSDKAYITQGRLTA
jgi:hypothetical protein